MERVIIYRLGSLGDTIVALPCFHLAERAFPDAQRLLLTNVTESTVEAPVEAMVRAGGFIHGTVAYPLGVRNPLALARLAWRLRRAGASTLVYLTESRGLASARRDLAYFKLCGFKKIIGVPLEQDLQEPRRGPNGDLERESHRLARNLTELGSIDFADRSWWDLRLTDAERAAAKEALGPLADEPFIAVTAGAKIPAKDWGEDNWGTLLAALAARFPGRGLAFVGAGDERDRADRLGARWPGGLVANLCGRLTPRESGAALANALLFVGHDSGPLHLADSVGTPSVGLFGDYNVPKLWHPSGESTRIIHRMEGLDTISPEEVAVTAEELIGARVEGGTTLPHNP